MVCNFIGQLAEGKIQLYAVKGPINGGGEQEDCESSGGSFRPFETLCCSW
jgi:hypothetical protein